MKRKRMSDYHSEIVKLAETGANNLQIATKLGIEPTSLRYYLKTRNIEVTNGRLTVQNDKELVNAVIKLHQDGYTYKEIGKRLQINLKTVPGILDANSINKRTLRESYRLNYTISDSAFSDFNDEETVYWYGWLLTDGCLSDDNSIALSLKSEDGYIVEKFKKYMGSNAKCTHSNYFHKQLQRNVQQSSFSIMDKITAGRLREQGMESRKSCKEQLPKFDWLNGTNAATFWRACVEGDGYIKKDVHSTCVDLVGSEELLNGFKLFCETHCGVKPNKKLRSRTYGDPNFRLISYSGIDSRNILRKLWSSGSIFLERKKATVENVLNYWNPKDFK